MADMSGSQILPSVTGAAWKGVQYFCTTRAGGVSAGSCASLNLAQHVGDAVADVRENRRRLAAALLPAEPLWLAQVHGTRVCDADLLAPSNAPPRADACATTQSRRVLAILTADCLPVVMADSEGLVVGVAHAGWRGLAAGVLERTLDCLRAKSPRAQGWRAWLGPAISQPYFEVGEDVLTAFVGADPLCRSFFSPGVRSGKWQADLAGLAGHRLRKAGVDHIQASGYCSFSQADLFYSYRRDAPSGRMATLAWLTHEDGE